MTYKIIHKLCPDNFLEQYKRRFSFSSYNTRNSQNFLNFRGSRTRLRIQRILVKRETVGDSKIETEPDIATYCKDATNVVNKHTM